LVENNNSLSNIINVFYLQNVIHEPTRINQNTGNGTLLDPVLISADCNVTFSEVIDVCREKSDHNATKISLQIPNYLQKTYQRTIWMYKNADILTTLVGMHSFAISKYLFVKKSAISSISLTNVKKDSSQKIRRNKVNNMIIHAKEQFYLNANGLLDENSNNPKAFWSLVKKFLSIYL
jgi:biopolymer transport protein ExbD